MGSKLKNLGLVGLGLIAGIAGSMQFDALAQRNASSPLPVEELRTLADVFGLIKSEYVEPVEDVGQTDVAPSEKKPIMQMKHVPKLKFGRRR